jgi:transcriptional regulator with XRE-family HTH domain
MMENPGFGAVLARLLDHRRLSAQTLADRAGSTADEVRAVLAGKSPDEVMLRLLAPALGFHAVDLFILAGWAVPEDLAPLDATAAKWVASMVTDAARLPETGRRELLQLIRSLPQEDRRSSFALKPHMPLTGGPGAWVVRMLQYRNLNWMGIAKTLAFVTPTYLSAATYGVIGSDRQELTPRSVTDFAAVLGIDACELAAVTGVSLRQVPPPPSPESADVAELLWEARRLSAAQARHVSELARALCGDPTTGSSSACPGP